ncbi:Murinoglobulin-1-like, partial [Homarus americanus]
VLVWYTRQDGEVVADIRELEVEKCLGSSVNLTWSDAQLEPGQQTTLTLSSEPNSVCSLGVVDRSSELLAVDPDPITLDKLFDFANNFFINIGGNSQINNNKYCKEQQRKEDLKKAAAARLIGDFVPLRRYSSYQTNFVDALKMFDTSGLYIFTDLTVETRPCEAEEAKTLRPQSIISTAGGHVAFSRPQSSFHQDFHETIAEDERFGLRVKGDSSKQADAPRTNFPETWLWDLLILP